MDLKIKTEMIAEVMSIIGVHPIETRTSDPSQVNKKIFSYGNNFQEKKKSSKRKSNSQLAKNKRKNELKIIQETKMEVQRSEKFKLIYPSYNVALYKKYFEVERANNIILRNE